MDVFHWDYLIVMHLPILLDGNRTVGKHRKTHEQTKRYKEFANCFVKLEKILSFGKFPRVAHLLFCIFDICASGHSDDIALVVVVVVYFSKTTKQTFGES